MSPVGVVLCVALLARAAHAAPTFVDVAAAAALRDRGALVLDARDQIGATHVPGAVRVEWKDYRDGWGRTGRLSDDDAMLSKKLSALGVDDHRAVLVYGAWSAGFGEEGRVAWMLRYLGHADVYVLDGGFAAWEKSGRAVEKGSVRASAGQFTIHRDPSLRVDIADMITAVRDHRATIVDVRTREEFAGARPYFEARGGHLPGARLLAFPELFGRNGQLVRTIELPRDRPVFVYCTGGVRSAFATLLLRALGYDARNFDASFWAWAARAELRVEK